VNKKIVIKHSGAVEISNKINLLQRRAWNILLANAYDDLPEKETHRVNIRDLLNALGLGKSKNDRHIKEMLKALALCGLEWNVLDKDGKNKWAFSTLLAQVVIENGICTYAYSPFLRERLYNPAMYARISLSMQNKFNSKHTLALYELCVDYFIAKRKYGETPFVSIEKFRLLMGFDDGKYGKFKDLNKHVIKPAIREINSKSDLFVDPEYKRQSRKVAFLKFHIKSHPDNKNPLLSKKLSQGPLIAAGEIKAETAVIELPAPEISNPELYRRLRDDFRLSDTQARKIISSHDENYISENLAYVEEQYKKGNIRNIGPYTLKALREDFRQRKTRFDTEKDQKAAEEHLRHVRKEIESSFQHNYERYRLGEIKKFRESLPQAELERTENDIREQVDRKYKGNSPSVQRLNFRMTLNEYLTEQAGVLSFEEWKKEEMKKYPRVFQE